MTPFIVVLAIALLIGAVMAGVGIAVRGRSTPDESPDRHQRTDDATGPAVHPDRPVPGSRTDRDRKGVTSDGISSPVAPRD